MLASIVYKVIHKHAFLSLPKIVFISMFNIEHMFYYNTFIEIKKAVDTTFL